MTPQQAKRRITIPSPPPIFALRASLDRLWCCSDERGGFDDILQSKNRRGKPVIVRPILRFASEGTAVQAMTMAQLIGAKIGQ